MMGFGSVGEGPGENSSSSISNLSALAPPFTVDRLNFNPMLSSNPVLNYSEMSYAVEPLSLTSQFASPSAPIHELDIHPTERTSMPLNDYQISDSIYLGPSGVHWSDSAFVYGGGVKSYYSPSVPPMIGEGSSINEYDGQSSNALTSSGLSVASQLGYNQQLLDFEYGPRWIDNVGFDDGKQVETVGLGGNFSSNNANAGGSYGYKTQVSQGIFDIPFGQTSQEVSGVPCRNLNRVSDSEVHSRQFALGNLEDRPFLEQNTDLFPYDHTKTCISVSCSIFPESHSLGKSCAMHQNVSNFQNLCCPYEKCVLPFDSSFPSSVSVVRSSPAVVIRPPPSANDFLGKDVTSYRTTHTDNIAVIDFEQSVPSKRKDSIMIPSYYLKEDFLLSASGKELTGPMQPKDNFPCKFKPGVGSQIPHTYVSSGFLMSCDNNQVVYPAVDSSDFVDHHNPYVDSPCWRGVPSSLFSAFDVGSRDSFQNNLDQCYDFDHKVHQNRLSFCDSAKAFSKKVGDSNNNDDNGCGRNSMYSLESTLYANSLSREKKLSDGAKVFNGTSIMIGGEGVQISNQPNFPNEPAQPRDSKSSYDVKVLDSKHLNVEEDAGLALNDVSEGGLVAVCAAEKVLASHSSQEAGYECSKPLPDTKFDVQTMIKAVHNLSELLLCHLSRDACSTLEEKNMEMIKSIISNLNACMRNIIDQETNKTKLNKFVRDTSAVTEESHCVDKILGVPVPCMTNKTLNSHVQPDYKHIGEEKKNKSPFFSPLREGVDIKRNDDMTKDIKRILDENFHCNEEISPKALFFKSLWLEAEANMFSIGYKACFDEMKIEMRKFEANALKESEDVAEMTTIIQSTPDPNTNSKLTPKAHGGTIPDPSLNNSLISSTVGNVNDDEASIMARFKILKSHEGNNKSMNVEKERQLEMGDGEHEVSIMEGFNILKSRENNLTLTNIGKAPQPEMANSDDLESILVKSDVPKPLVDILTSINEEKELHPDQMVNDEHAESVMARFDILKSRVASSRINVKEEQQAEMVGVQFFCKKNIAAVKNDQSEAEVFYSSPKPQQTESLDEHKFGSHLDGDGYESPKELHFSVSDDAMVHSFDERKMMNLLYRKLHDTSSYSDWQYIHKDDLA